MTTLDIQLLIPQLLRRIRLAKQLSQEELARKAELDRTYISGIERGVRNISLKTLGKLLGALELDPEQFANELIHEIKANNM